MSGRTFVMAGGGTAGHVMPALAVARELVPDLSVVEINPDTTPLTEAADFSFRERAGEILPRIDSLLAGGPAGTSP